MNKKLYSFRILCEQLIKIIGIFFVVNVIIIYIKFIIFVIQTCMYVCMLEFVVFVF